MSGRKRKSPKVVVRVRVPGDLADALEDHVSYKRRTVRSNEANRSAVVAELLRAVIDGLKESGESFATLLIREAVREATQELHYTTIADLRRRLGAVPGTVLDKTLLALEREGAFRLAPSYNGNVHSEAEREGGIKDRRRGNLVYAVTHEPVRVATPNKTNPSKVRRSRVR